MLKIVYHPQAEAEQLEALPFYGSREPGMHDLFLAAIDRHVREIAAMPQRFPKVGREIRRCVIRKYPFIIFFQSLSRSHPHSGNRPHEQTSRLLEAADLKCDGRRPPLVYCFCAKVGVLREVFSPGARRALASALLADRLGIVPPLRPCFAQAPVL